MTCVLLAEGDRSIAERIIRWLHGATAGELEVAWADCAQRCISTIGRKPPDLVLLDLALSGGSLELFDTLRRRFPGLPVLVITAVRSDGAALEALARGAADHLVLAQLDAYLLLRTIRYVLQRQNTLRMQARIDAAEHEMAIARQIQESLLPHGPPQIPGYQIAGLSFPARHVGGDYYDYFSLGDGCLGIAIGDASGHGIGAALVSAHTRATMRTLAMTHRSVSEILTLANRILTVDVRQRHFVTLFISRLNPQTGSFVYASAGHDPGFLLDAEGRLKARLDSTGIPLGILADSEYPNSIGVSLCPGDVVCLMTDGVREAGADQGAMFGTARAIDLVAEHHAAPPIQIAHALAHAVRRHCLPHQPGDDLTIIVVKMVSPIRAPRLP